MISQRIDDILAGLRKDAWSGYATQADMIENELVALRAELATLKERTRVVGEA